MARIAGVDLPRNKKVEFAIQYIYGIGAFKAKAILTASSVDPNICLLYTSDAADE